MKRLIIFCFLLVTTHLFAQIYPTYISPVKVGNMNLQAGKVFFQNNFNGTQNLNKLAEKFKSKQQVYAVFNLNSVNPSEIKGTITNYQLNIDQYGEKRKKLAPFLVRPLNATFNIESVDGKSKVTVSNIWFKSMPGETGSGHRNIEAMITSKNATVFLKKKKMLKSIAIIDKNLEELFNSAISGNNGF